ncbi:universal stress family protein [Roseivivax marinus]|jgi:nucleotide-binding universal stress UspA family protein|uniref:Universal stress protein n=1 Tax=Roseivivax marinus TaxID=1379903 RepID=W4HNH4_9RHOB|nr:universal stress protein [Roseivivax marinus]ETW13948.1 universal stress family protein [Roseivivax marinus]UMA63776.1 universal stress protein [Roseivivax marinus]SEK90315.1 Nucleotide-binding universal stress protein, UspA family [Roseivivax marinus]
MFKSILVAIDLNDPMSWEQGLPQAAELAKASGGALHLMTVVPDMGMPLVEEFFPAHYEEQALTAAKERLDQLARDSLPADTPHTQHVALGQITQRIVETAEQTGADLIVMASHDPDLAQNFLIGGHAGKVVRRSPVSVLVVRA